MTALTTPGDTRLQKLASGVNAIESTGPLIITVASAAFVLLGLARTLTRIVRQDIASGSSA